MGGRARRATETDAAARVAEGRRAAAILIGFTAKAHRSETADRVVVAENDATAALSDEVYIVL